MQRYIKGLNLYDKYEQVVPIYTFGDNVRVLYYHISDDTDFDFVMRGRFDYKYFLKVFCDFADMLCSARCVDSVQFNFEYGVILAGKQGNSLVISFDNFCGLTLSEKPISIENNDVVSFDLGMILNLWKQVVSSDYDGHGKCLATCLALMLNIVCGEFIFDRESVRDVCDTQCLSKGFIWLDSQLKYKNVSLYSRIMPCLDTNYLISVLDAGYITLVPFAERTCIYFCSDGKFGINGCPHCVLMIKFGDKYLYLDEVGYAFLSRDDIHLLGCSDDSIMLDYDNWYNGCCLWAIKGSV